MMMDEAMTAAATSNDAISATGMSMAGSVLLCYSQAMVDG